MELFELDMDELTERILSNEQCITPYKAMLMVLTQVNVIKTAVNNPIM